MKNGTVPEGGPGDFNARILVKIAKSRLTRYQGGGLRTEVVLRSPEGKRLYARYFNSFQGNMEIMETMARYQFPRDVTNDADQAIRQCIDTRTDGADQEIAAAQILFEANGVRCLVDYPDEPITVIAFSTSANGLDYVKLMQKTDQLIAMLDTLAAANLIDGKQCAIRKSYRKRAVRQIAGMVLIRHL